MLHGYAVKGQTSRSCYGGYGKRIARRVLPPWPKWIKEGSRVSWTTEKYNNSKSPVYLTKTGTVVQITDQIIVLHNGRYKECFSRKDISDGTVEFAKAGGGGAL